MTANQTYKNPKAGVPLITTIISGCSTPLLEIKYCNLINAFYYKNSPTIARYSITCVIDPEEHKDFLKGLQTIEKNEKVESILKTEAVKDNENYVTTGKVLIKFQGKDTIPVYVVNEKNESVPITLEDELARGENVIVTYDILRYTKKNTVKTEHGISFKPTAIFYYPKAQ